MRTRQEKELLGLEDLSFPAQRQGICMTRFLPSLLDTQIWDLHNSKIEFVWPPPKGSCLISADFVFNFGILRGSICRRVNSLGSLQTLFEFFPCQSDYLQTGKTSNSRFYPWRWYHFYNSWICMTTVIQIHTNYPCPICMSWAYPSSFLIVHCLDWL